MIDLQDTAQSQGYRGGLRLGCRDRFDPNELKAYRKVAGDKLDIDGLPFPGGIFTYQDAYYCYYNEHEQKYSVGKYDSHAEDAIVESVRVFTNRRAQEGGFQQAAIQFRVARPINIGDKMASRHGQKGICSRLWATTDMPWTENGIVPDLIFNPHGFPSRMTVGMMIEFIAGKAAMVNGRVYDSTPFVFDEGYPADEHFGKVLKEAGLNYHGYERMYSGISGEELEADIFFGPVYYQRLRHMVYDKFQARADKGPIDPYTQQPVKGRARGGGVRMGEMERDGLISHGCAFIARDRLFHCSDFYKTRICTVCGSVLSVSKVKPDKTKDKNWKLMSNGKWECRICGPEAKTLLTDLPYVVKYLAAELAGMNVKLDFKFAKEDKSARTEVLEIVEKMER